MARDSQMEPLTDEQLAAFKAKLEEQGRELREALAEDLGGEPEDYRAERVVGGDGD